MLTGSWLTPPWWLQAHGTLCFRCGGCSSSNPLEISPGTGNKKGKQVPSSYCRTWSGNDESLKCLGKSYLLSRISVCSHWLFCQTITACHPLNHSRQSQPYMMSLENHHHRHQGDRLPHLFFPLQPKGFDFLAREPEVRFHTLHPSVILDTAVIGYVLCDTAQS